MKNQKRECLATLLNIDNYSPWDQVTGIVFLSLSPKPDRFPRTTYKSVKRFAHMNSFRSIYQEKKISSLGLLESTELQIFTTRLMRTMKDQCQATAKFTSSGGHETVKPCGYTLAAFGTAKYVPRGKNPHWWFCWPAGPRSKIQEIRWRLGDEEVTKSDKNSDCDDSISDLSFRHYPYVFWLKEIMSHAEGETWHFIFWNTGGSCGGTPAGVSSRSVTKLIIFD